MALVRIDLGQPQKIQHQLVEANKRLAREAEAPAAVRGLVGELADSMVELGDEDTSGFDPYLIVSLQRAALGAVRALQLDDPAEERKQLRLRIEQMRQVFRDLEAGQPVSEDRPIKEVARWLADTVAVPQRELASLIGVGERTFQRWASETEQGEPDPDDARRLRVLARLVNQLRHSFTGVGVIRWFERPRTDLEGQRPIELIDEPDAVGRLLMLAAGARSSGAT